MESLSKLHNKYYKHLLLLSVLLLVSSFGYLGFFYSQNNDFIYKDISLTGGTTVTITDKVNAEDLKRDLEDKLDEIAYENQKLAALRDLLLPKLMKGEILVSEK